MGWPELLTEDTHVFKVYIVPISIISSISYYPMYAVLELKINNTTTQPGCKFSRHPCNKKIPGPTLSEDPQLYNIRVIYHILMAITVM